MRPKFTRTCRAQRGRLGCVPDDLDQTAHALGKSLPNDAPIEIVEVNFQTDLPHPRLTASGWEEIEAN
jgi:hypothetical protein